MVYTPEEKQKIEELMKVFDHYIKTLADYDLLYSEKVGYIWLLTADNADYLYFPIKSRDAFLCSLVEDVLFDEELICGTPINYTKVRRIILVMLSRLENDYEHCVDILDDCLDRHRNFQKLFFGED